MRRTERIPIFLELLDWGKFVDKYKIDYNPRELYTDWILRITIKWLENPDWRFGQLLINLHIAPDGGLWNKEEGEILEEQGIDPRKYLLWGSYGLDLDKKAKTWKKRRKRFGLSKKDITIDPTMLILAEDKQSKRLYHSLQAWYNTKPTAEYKPIKDLDTDHIKNILKTQLQISKKYKDTFKKELELRENEQSK